MARKVEEKARFRGDDKAYAENWDRIFGEKKETCSHYNILGLQIYSPPFWENRCEDCNKTLYKEDDR